MTTTLRKLMERGEIDIESHDIDPGVLNLIVIEKMPQTIDDRTRRIWSHIARNSRHYQHGSSKNWKVVWRQTILPCPDITICF